MGRTGTAQPCPGPTSRPRPGATPPTAPPLTARPGPAPMAPPLQPGLWALASPGSAPPRPRWTCKHGAFPLALAAVCAPGAPLARLPPRSTCWEPHWAASLDPSPVTCLASSEGGAALGPVAPSGFGPSQIASKVSRSLRRVREAQLVGAGPPASGGACDGGGHGRGGPGGSGSLPAPPTTCASRDRGFSRRPLLVPGGPTHLVHRLRLETIRKFTHKMRPRLVLALRVAGGKNNNKQQKKSLFQMSREQTGALPSHSVTPRAPRGCSLWL